jgi:sugar lactone lactonase YvrE
MKIPNGVKAILGIILAVTFFIVPSPALATVTAEVNSAAGDVEYGYQDGSADTALLCFPYGLAINKEGGLIIVDSYNNRIRLLKDNQVSTLAGFSDQTDDTGLPVVGYADGAALKARFNHPRGAAVDSKGNIFISDTGNNAIRIITEGKVYTLAGSTKAGYSDAKGNKAQFNMPSGMAFDSADNLYIADTMNHVIRCISSSGEVTTFAGIASEGGYLDGAAKKALFNEPSDVAVDGEGSVYVLDSGNQLIRKIKDGVVSTIAGTNSDKITGTSYSEGGFKNGSSDEARFNFPMGIDVAEDGTIFIADTWNHRIRVIQKDGSVGTLAGSGIPGLVNGKVDEAEFNGPVDVLYSNGILYISDMWNNSIRTMNLHLGKIETIVDRSDIEEAYHFDVASDEIQVWYEGSRIGFPTIQPYKDGTKLYVPLKYVFNAWGAKVKWIIKNEKLLVKKPGFYRIFSPGKDMTFKKDGYTYIDTESLGRLTGLRIEWFPEYNALVIEER